MAGHLVWGDTSKAGAAKQIEGRCMCPKSMPLMRLKVGSFGISMSNARRTNQSSTSSMPNIAALLKLEIARVARKQIRAEVDSLRKAVTAQKTSIAELKRVNQGLQQQLRRLEKSHRKPAAEEQVDDTKKMRFSAKGFASLRQRLGLSANSMGALLGVSGQSIYKWETGDAAPRARYLASIAALRGVGKKEVAKRLEELNAQ